MWFLQRGNLKRRVESVSGPYHVVVVLFFITIGYAVILALKPTLWPGQMADSLSRVMQTTVMPMSLLLTFEGFWSDYRAINHVVRKSSNTGFCSVKAT